MTPGYIPPNKQPTQHLIAESRLRDLAASWVECDCGVRVDGRNAREAGERFASHRRSMGVAS